LSIALYYFTHQLFSEIQVATISLVPWPIIVMKGKRSTTTYGPQNYD